MQKAWKLRLEQSIRLVEVGQLVAELIHDIKHPTAAISSAAQTLQSLPNMEWFSVLGSRFSVFGWIPALTP